MSGSGGVSITILGTCADSGFPVYFDLTLLPGETKELLVAEEWD